MKAALVARGILINLAIGEFGYNTSTTNGTNWYEATEANRQQWIQDAIRVARDYKYVEFLNLYLHDNGVTGTGFNIHGTGSETAFTTASRDASWETHAQAAVDAIRIAEADGTHKFLWIPLEGWSGA